MMKWVRKPKHKGLFIYGCPRCGMEKHVMHNRPDLRATRCRRCGEMMTY